eukprot:TRINITY_DN6742_c0_g1_i1.p1 TRINITY_DN6742_c0_g1~~TRINITY_DN6742_c0_g1_i1.p1  ORF type:complete len:119 (+),score=10.71 TRINITY_DN6742_c0_g1_i1:2-358(+)
MTDDGSDLFRSSLDTYREMWLAVTIWNMVGLGTLYFICGFIAALAFRRKTKAIIFIPFASTLFGVLAGLAEGALFALVIALIYISGPFAMQWWMAAVWGLGLSIFYLILSLLRIITQW